jgi:lipoprotein-anchoring transpeptidase ErfK/SrfK
VTYPKFTRLDVGEVKRQGGRDWFSLDDGHWVKAGDLTYRTPGSLPEDVRAEERWIDIELERQVMTAYVGITPIFSTLVSSGRGRGEAEDATPLGEHRIWVKLRSSDMDNLENEDAGRYYAMQSVPWVMYFKKGYGLHGAFWHRDFGRRRSHGCVNLTPLDAQKLFFWASPRLPAGWTAVFPTRYERGTLVRVR